MRTNAEAIDPYFPVAVSIYRPPPKPASIANSKFIKESYLRVFYSLFVETGTASVPGSSAHKHLAELADSIMGLFGRLIMHGKLILSYVIPRTGYTVAGILLLAVIIPSNSLASSAKYNYDNPQLNDEMDNIYKKIGDVPRGTYKTSSMTLQGITVDSITVNSSIKLTNGLTGTTTNDNAAAGKVGEYVEAISASNVNAAATTVFDDLISISLTAGDWDVLAMLYADRNSATIQAEWFFIGTVSGNNTTGSVVGSNSNYNGWANLSTMPDFTTNNIPPYRMSLNATTTVYLKRYFQYSSGTPRTAGARLSARRDR